MSDEKLAALTAPFPPDTLKLRAIAFSSDRSRALAVSYVDARVVAERLDTVCPGWSLAMTVVPVHTDTAVVKATLTIDGVSRTDFGECAIEYERRPDGTDTAAVKNEPWKAAASDAFKRAAAQFGVGRYLYQLPRQWLPWDAQRNTFASTSPAPAAGGDERESGATDLSAQAGSQARATQRQVQFIRELYDSLGEGVPRKIETMSKTEASALIDALRERVRSGSTRTSSED